MEPKSKNLVFIVDDDPDDRQIILDAFLENNSIMDYVFIEDGEELMQLLNAASPEELPTLIILDLNMPGIMGLQVLKEIKLHPRFNYIPSVILTTSSASADRKASYRAGANCFLTKPKSYAELVEMTDAIANLWFR